jgi:uncharacterized protein
VNGGAYPSSDRVRFAVKLTPKGGRDAIGGWVTDAAGNPILKARVSAPPEDGKANAALIVLLAGALGLKKADVKIVSGAASRTKLVEINGDRALLAKLQGA